MKLLYEKHHSTKHANDLSFKHIDDAGIDFQVFGVLKGPCPPDKIPPLFHHEYLLEANQTYKTFCGVRIHIPKGYLGIFLPRSSWRNKGLIVQSVWDSGYTGWVMPFITLTQSQYISPGERMFQLVLHIKPEGITISSDNIDALETSRGDKGQGSTGRF
jgi:dUTPase